MNTDHHHIDTSLRDDHKRPKGIDEEKKHTAAAYATMYWTSLSV